MKRKNINLLQNSSLKLTLHQEKPLITLNEARQTKQNYSQEPADAKNPSAEEDRKLQRAARIESMSSHRGRVNISQHSRHRSNSQMPETLYYQNERSDKGCQHSGETQISVPDVEITATDLDELRKVDQTLSLTRENIANDINEAQGTFRLDDSHQQD